MDTTKKISFGFTKLAKKPSLVTTLPSTEKTDSAPVEYIKCLEGQQIKLLVEKVKKDPLIVPLKKNEKTASALASLKKRKAVLLGEDEEPSSTNSKNILQNTNTDSLEQKAIKELLAAAEAIKNGVEYETSVTDSQLVLPLSKSADQLPLDGAKESTIDDYESIPIQDFGKAMLRGMGWDEKETEARNLPPLRPKGMGLGADKAIRPKPLLIPAEANEVLSIKKNACVRILAGKHKDLYGRVQGMDDYACRVIVQMAIGGNIETFNEFLCQPVSQKEYSEYGKCLNTNKYKEYKQNENNLQIKTESNESKEQYYEKKIHKKENRRKSYDDEKIHKTTNSINDISKNNKSEYYESQMPTKKSLQKSTVDLELKSREYYSSLDSNKLYKFHKYEQKIKKEEKLDRQEKKMAKRYDNNAESDLSGSWNNYSRRDSRKKTLTKIDSSSMLSDDELSRINSATETRKKKKKKGKKHKEVRRKTELTDSNDFNSRSSSKRQSYSRSPSGHRRSVADQSSSDDDSSKEPLKSLRQKKDKKRT